LLWIFFVEECRKNKNKLDPKDKDKYYFIDSYGNNNTNFSIDSKNEIIIFTHIKTNKQTNGKEKTNKTFLIVILIIIIVIALFVGIYLFIKNKRIQNNLLEENEFSQYHFSK
jgi:ABC-type transport system involved in multi-copper enzyme maturation permease subunit